MCQEEKTEALVVLTTVQNPIDSEILQDLLKQEKIPVLVRDNEASGGMLKLYLGYSAFGDTLYVRQKDYVRANEIIEQFTRNEETTIGVTSIKDNESIESFDQMQVQQSLGEKKQNDRKIFMIGALFLVVIGIVYITEWIYT